MSWIITGTQKNNWTPADIDTALWLDAADASTITESGGAITAWADKSGNGHNAAADGNPTYSATGMSTSKPAVQLDGTGDALVSSITGIGSFDALDVYMVTQTLTAASSNVNSGLFWALGNVANASGSYPGNRSLNSTSSTGSLNGEFINFGFENSSFSAGRLGSSTYRRAANTAQILNTKHSTSGTSLFANGEQVNLNITSQITTSTNTAPSNIGYAVDSDLHFGAIRVSGSLLYSPAIKFAEIVVSSTLLSTANRQKLEGYLAHKWGLTADLPGDHPYKTTVPVP
jgi:hypothetical protein